MLSMWLVGVFVVVVVVSGVLFFFSTTFCVVILGGRRLRLAGGNWLCFKLAGGFHARVFLVRGIVVVGG